MRKLSNNFSLLFASIWTGKCIQMDYQVAKIDKFATFFVFDKPDRLWYNKYIIKNQ